LPARILQTLDTALIQIMQLHYSTSELTSDRGKAFVAIEVIIRSDVERAQFLTAKCKKIIPVNHVTLSSSDNSNA
jgi:hypothetical protein